MQRIKDCKNHLVCIADEETGTIDSRYKRYGINVNLPVGSEIRITREGIETIITRINRMEFNVDSHPISAA